MSFRLTCLLGLLVIHPADGQEPLQPPPFDYIIEESESRDVATDGTIPYMDGFGSDEFGTRDFKALTVHDGPGASTAASFQIKGLLRYDVETGRLYVALSILDDVFMPGSDDLQVELMVDIDYNGGEYRHPEQVQVAQRYVIPAIEEGSSADVATLASNTACFEESAGSMRRNRVPYGLSERDQVETEFYVVVHGHETCDRIGSLWRPEKALYDTMTLVGIDLAIVDADPDSWYRFVLSGNPESRDNADHLLRFWLAGDWEPPRPSAVTQIPWATLKHEGHGR